MSKNHIWIGNFSTEKEFEKYIDQSVYFQAWNKYNNEPLQDSEEDKPSNELRCLFCKEIGMDWYDEDFLQIHFEPSGNFNALLSRIPANLKNVLSVCREKNIANGNAFICYSAKEVSKNEYPENSRGIVYLGAFPEATPIPLVEDEDSRLGLTDCVWIGLISDNKETFMGYFDQKEYLSFLSNKKKPKENFSCDFCRDINIPYYLPENLQIFYAEKSDKAQAIIEKSITNQKLLESVLWSVKDFSDSSKFNVLVHLVQHETKKEKEEPKVRIYPKSLMGKYPLPKKFVEEKENYNGLKYLGKYAWH